MNQIGLNLAAFTTGTAKMVASLSLHEKFARVDLTVWWGEDANIGLALIPLTLPLALLNLAGSARALLNMMSPPSDKTIFSTNTGHGRPIILDQTGVLASNPTLGFQNRGNRKLIVGRRGATICSLVAQILEDPNQTPLVPAIPMPLS